jgi:hypothetical protein
MFGDRKRFRRAERMERRMLRRSMRFGGLVTPVVMIALSQAHALFASSRFAEAAAAYERIAATAQANGNPRAARFYALAARANWRAGNIPHGLDLLKTGLGLLAAMGAVEVFNVVASNAIRDLTALGHAREADEVREFAAHTPGWAELPAGYGPAEPAEAQKAVLPASCPKCGATVHADEIEWIDERTAECAYCGTPLRAEG